jgi:DegV family protein with EDD domain
MSIPSKKPVGVVVDEAADLPQEIVKKHQIGIVPLNVHWSEIEGIPGENIFQRIKELEKRGDNSFAKTSQPSPKAFLDVFKKQLEVFEKVICLTITSKHSGTYNSGCQAKRFLGKEGERIFIFDSLNGTCGLGLIVLRVVDLIKKKCSVEEILKDLESYIKNVHLRVLLEDTKRIEASGRISPTIASWMRKMQKVGIRPLIGIKNGKISPLGVKVGVKDISTTLFKELESKTKKSRNQGKRIRAAITHCDNIEGAKRLKAMVEEKLKNIEVAFVNLVDDVLGSLLGPDSLVVAWAPAE